MTLTLVKQNMAGHLKIIQIIWLSQGYQTASYFWDRLMLALNFISKIVLEHAVNLSQPF